MFILSQFLESLALLIALIINVFIFVLIIRVILSWVNPDPYNEIVQVIYRITDPVLLPFRRLPLQVGGIDFSPIIAFFILIFLRNFLVNVLYQIAARIG